MMPCCVVSSHCLSFFFNETPPTEISTLSLHAALPLSAPQHGFSSANTPHDTEKERERGKERGGEGERERERVAKRE